MKLLVDKNIVTVARKNVDNMQYESEKNSEMEEVLSIINTNRLSCEVSSLEII